MMFPIPGAQSPQPYYMTYKLDDILKNTLTPANRQLIDLWEEQVNTRKEPRCNHIDLNQGRNDRVGLYLELYQRMYLMQSDGEDD